MNYLSLKLRKTNPHQNANIFSNLFFTYTLKIFKKGYKSNLVEDDLYEVLPNYKSEELGNRFEEKWEMLKNKSNKPSILALLWNCFRVHYFLLCLTQIIPIATTICRPHVIKQIIKSFVRNDNDAYVYGAILILIVFVDFLYDRNLIMRLKAMALQIRVAFTSFIYRKILKTHPAHYENISIGKIITLITKDINDFEDFINLWSHTWIDIIKILVTIYVLYKEVGLLAFIVVGVVLILILLQTCFSYLIFNVKMKTSKKTDERYETIKEILCAIKCMKFSCWRKILESRISKIRKNEIHTLHILFHVVYIKHAWSFLITNISIYLLISASMWYQITTIETFFFIITCLHRIENPLTSSIPECLTDAANIVAAVRRIDDTIKIIDTIPDIQQCTISPKVTEILRNKNKLTIINHLSNNEKNFLLKQSEISYASEEPWLFPSTIKQNILFGTKYCEKRYYKVLEVCALLQDLKCFENGDKTIVADKGSNLSKGQQVRINLARAVYKESQIYLLDHCLSNLDVVVADFIFEKCIFGFLKNKTVIMVTTNQRYINRDENEVYIDQLQSEVTFSTFSKIDSNEETKLILKETENNIYEERNEFRRVSFKVYKDYYRFSGSPILCIVFICLATLFQILRISKDKVENEWINTQHKILNYTKIISHNEVYTGMIEKHTRLSHLYLIIILLSPLTLFIQSVPFFKLVRNISINLHNLIITKMTNAPMDFFHNNFLGTIMNRFSNDFSNVDTLIPKFLLQLSSTIMTMIFIIILIATVNITLLIPSFIFIALLYIVKTLCMRTGQRLRQLQIATRNPLLGHINATLNGLTTIKASKTENILRQEFDRHQDLNTTASYMYLCCLEAFCFASDLLCTLFLVFVITNFLIFNKSTSVGHVGLVISQTLVLTYVVEHVIYKWAQLENNMVSFERVLEYANLKQEQKPGIIMENWPYKGKIQFQNFNLSYSNFSEPVLKNINFLVKPKEKIAVVGRTGIGKSSIIFSLLRMYEINGRILIDDVDVKLLSLDFFRSRISVVPQEPVLLSGTIRENFDPIEIFSDEEIWKAIETIDLKNKIPSLDFKINDGSTFNISQKQLIYFGRAILENNKILVLDEIAENNDNMEDKIYEIIKQNFGGSTVLIITHKPEFANKFDKVLVLDNNTMVEYDHPSTLLQNENGVFKKMFTKSTA